MKEYYKKRENNQGNKCAYGFGIPTGHMLYLISYRCTLMYSIHAVVVMKLIAAFA